MDVSWMISATSWWVIFAVVLVGAELLTGSFYLLMIATGAVAGALAAYMDLGANEQMAVVAVVSIAATVSWHLWRKSRKVQDAPAAINPDVNLDIGETVQVGTWRSDGTAQIQYRGAPWTVQAVEGAALEPGLHRICAVVGNRLVVEKYEAGIPVVCKNGA